jgi:hypothetical protein
MSYILNSQIFLDFLSSLKTNDLSYHQISIFKKSFSMHEIFCYNLTKSLSILQKLKLSPNTIIPKVRLSFEDILELIYKNPNDPNLIQSINSLSSLPDFSQQILSVDKLDSQIPKILSNLFSSSFDSLSNSYISFFSCLISQYCIQINYEQKVQFIKQKIHEFQFSHQVFNPKMWILSNIKYELFFHEGNESDLISSFHELYDYLMFSSSFIHDLLQDILYVMIRIAVRLKFKGIFYSQISSIAFLMSGMKDISSPLDSFFKSLIPKLEQIDYDNLVFNLWIRIQKEQSSRDFLQHNYQQIMAIHQLNE